MNGVRPYDFALARYDPDGSLDSSFSGDGKQTTDFIGNNDVGHAVIVQTDGKVVVAGESNQGPAMDFALARYNANGTLDSSFSGDGKQTTDFTGGDDVGRALAVQTDGKVVVAGHSYQGAATNIDFALARYNANGTLDGAFSGDGKQKTDFAGGGDAGAAVAVQADGRILVAGYSGSDFAVARYEGPDTTAPETTIDSGPSGATSDSTPTFDFSSSEQESSFECRVDAGAFAPCSSPHTTAALAEGAHAFEVRATDPAGNTDESPASRTFMLDIAAPDTTIDSGPSGTTADNTPTFGFSSSESDSSFECRLDAGAFAPCSSPYTTAALADGAHTFEVRAIDPAGNTDQTPATRSFAVATAPPDSDGDGIPDASDACPAVPGTMPDGCQIAAPPPDSDGDGVPNASDACPLVVGTLPNGCPARWLIPNQ